MSARDRDTWKQARAELGTPPPTYRCDRGHAYEMETGNQLRVWGQDGSIHWIELCGDCMKELHRLIDQFASSTRGTKRFDLDPAP